MEQSSSASEPESPRGICGSDSKAALDIVCGCSATSVQGKMLSIAPVMAWRAAGGTQFIQLQGATCDVYAPCDRDPELVPVRVQGAEAHGAAAVHVVLFHKDCSRTICRQWQAGVCCKA